LKSKKQNINIRELFRQKLEDSEVIPDAAIRSKLMRKVAFREFMIFNPVRFNIYYIGGILVAGITAAIILFSGNGNTVHLTSLNNSNEINNTVITENLKVPVEATLVKQSDRISEKTSESLNKKPKIRSEVTPVTTPAQNIESITSNIVTQTAVKDTFYQKDIFPGSSVKNKLQGGFRKEKALFETSAEKGCTPLKIHFINKSSSFDSCRWTFGDGGYSNDRNPEWIFDVEGEYKVELIVFGSDGLSVKSFAFITVYPRPKARFEISPEKAVLPDDEIRFLNYSTGGVEYNWDFGDGSSSDLFEPNHRYSKFGNYNVGLVATSEFGCSDSLFVLNAFSGSEYFIDFPNAFIPNMDGPTGGFYSSKSDEGAQVFHPVFSGVSDFQLKIFSKFGILIFESNDINIGWDGYFKGQLSNPGVYIWKVRGNFRNGEPFIKMGDVTLLRN
jgi:PKD repeat protein